MDPIVMAVNAGIPLNVQGATFVYANALCFVCGDGSIVALTQGDTFSCGDKITVPSGAVVTRQNATITLE